MPGNELSRKEIRDRFVELRKRLGWSVSQAARELEVDQPSVTAWEKARRSIPRKHLREIAARAGEPESYLMVADPLDLRRPTRDRLIAADWMARTAEALRDSATQEAEDVAGHVLGGLRGLTDANEGEG
jgi:transcriptional regulator with XRE-family HTH domain